MANKTISGHVYDDQGDPIPDCEVHLLDTGDNEMGRETSQSDGRYEFSNIELEVGQEYTIQCVPPKGHAQPEAKTIQVEARRRAYGDLDFTLAHVAPDHEILYDACVDELVDDEVEELLGLSESCLCDAFKQVHVDVTALCKDPDTDSFETNINDQLEKLYDYCSEASHLISDREALRELTCTELYDKLKEYEEQLSDIMTAYKGLYDLILIEISTQQVQVKDLAALKGALAGPFECYQCIQKPLNTALTILAKGWIGSCLDGLAGRCEALEEAGTDLIDDLRKLGGTAPPPAATDFLSKIEALQDDITSVCQGISTLSAGYQDGDDPRESLHQYLEQVRQLQEHIIGLLTELMEAVRLQKLLPSWSGRAAWLASAKQGLKELWEQITPLIHEIRECLNNVKTAFAPPQPMVVTQAGPGVPGTGATGTPGLAGIQQSIDGLGDLLEDIAAWTTPTSGGSLGWGGTTGVAAEARVQQVVQNVLGRPIGGNPSAFLAAMTAAFPEKEGKIVREPVRAVVSLEAESGQLAASQGTLSHEVQLVVTDALKLLDGLRPIGPDTDQERAEALKEIIHSEFSSLLREAGRVDRPRKSKTDEIFAQLLPLPNQPLTGYLGQLRDELGLNTLGDDLSNPDLVTSEEAQLIASMGLLEQYAITVYNAYDRFFGTGPGKDPRDGSFSGRLAFVNTLLSVVAASIREVEASMDAVEFSQPERRVTFIRDRKTGGNLISIDGILSWIEDLALQEGPDLIARSGLIGLNRVLDIVNNRLEPLVDELVKISQGTSGLNPPPAPHPGLRHSRVRNALRQLLSQLLQFNP
jgi:hypothetical protein